jgi:hypothetical protein
VLEECGGDVTQEDALEGYEDGVKEGLTDESWAVCVNDDGDEFLGV